MNFIGLVRTDNLTFMSIGLRVSEMQRSGFKAVYLLSRDRFSLARQFRAAVVVTSMKALAAKLEQEPPDTVVVVSDSKIDAAALEALGVPERGFVNVSGVGFGSVPVNGLDRPLCESFAFSRKTMAAMAQDLVAGAKSMGDYDTGVQQRSAAPVQPRRERRFGRVMVAMATQPHRFAGAMRVIRDIWPQCDDLRVCLNGFDDVPSELASFMESASVYAPGKTIASLIAGPGRAVEDLGCDNKMLWVDECQGYYLTVDDDIVYPPDYVEKLVAGIDRFGGRAVCSFYGKLYRKSGGKVVPNYLAYRKIPELPQIGVDNFGISREIGTDFFVNCPGMGVGGFVPSVVRFSSNDFRGTEKNSGDDESAAIACARRGLKCVCLERRRMWLVQQPSTDDVGLCSNLGNIMRRWNRLNSVSWSYLGRTSMNVVYITDDGADNIRYLRASLRSLIANSRCNLHVYVIESREMPGFEAGLRTLEGPNVAIDFIVASESLVARCAEANRRTAILKRASATGISLLKFELCNLLSVKSVLFLDTDTIVLNDLTAAYLDTDAFELSAVKDEGLSRVNTRLHPVHANKDYFNSGVMFMNLDMMRRNRTSEKLWRAKATCVDQNLVDQNAFNVVYHGKVRLIHPVYNYHSGNPMSPVIRVMHFCAKCNKPIAHPDVVNADVWREYDA